MAHNSYIRPGNVWSGSKTFLTVELTALALQVYQSLNADLGGTWAPASVITIGGSGMTITGPSQLSDLRFFSQTSGASEFLNASGVTFYDTSLQLFTETSTLSLNADANLIVGGDVDVTVSTSHTVQWSAPLHFSAGLHTYDGITIAGAQTRTGKTTFSGTGGRRIGRSVSKVNAAANSTVGNEVDHVKVSLTDGVNRALTLRVSESVPAAGDEAVETEEIHVDFVRTISTTATCQVVNEGGTIMLTFTGPSSALLDANRGGATFKFDGTRWRVKNKWGLADVASLDP